MLDTKRLTASLFLLELEMKRGKNSIEEDIDLFLEYAGKMGEDS